MYTNPLAATSLYGLEALEQNGRALGATLFVSMSAAYDGLPDAMKKRFNVLESVQSAAFPFERTPQLGRENKRTHSVCMAPPLTLVIATLLVGMMVFGTGMASGQDYPNKPIRIVATETGGSGDVVMRLMVGEGLPQSLGQPVVVDNRSPRLVGEIVARATPDGYTLLMNGSSFWTTPFLQKTPYDPVKDFLPITLVAALPNVLVVHPSMPVKSVKELIALAKAKPGQLNYSTTGPAGANSLAAELFKSMAGVDIVGIPYKSAGAALNAVISGEVQVMFPNTGAAAPLLKSGRLKALAVTSIQPSLLVPGLPTVAASGLPGYESGNLNGMFAPAKTPASIINRLNQETVRLLNRPAVKEKFLSAGVEVVASSPQEFAAVIKGDMARVGKLIKEAGIKAE